MIKIVCISDTHEAELEPEMFPDGDILVHAGDLTYRGTIDSVTAAAKQLGKLRNKFERIIAIPGNHDFLFEKEPVLARKIMEEHGIDLLINESLTTHGLKFWGSPTCPPFGRWAFYKNDKEREELWNSIPNDTDVVITHGPAEYILDEVECINHMGYSLEHTGCEYLHKRLMELKPQLHVCGHIHEGYGKKLLNGTIFINASYKDERYRPVNKPIVVEL